jgi:pantoate--beta-alanine ligase
MAAPLVVRDAASLREALRARRALGPVGFVPTMGYLHDGHEQLMRRSRAADGTVVVSIFVNPTQFGPTEDFATYPRDFEADMARCARAEVDILFAPTPAVMYPAGASSVVRVGGVSEPLEGERRPGHFQGVATVVTSLFNLVQPDHAYFGEKDWQQLAVIRQMVHDLHVPVTIVGVPTVREADGVAQSSRNVRLSPESRVAARAIPRAIARVAQAYAAGERGTDVLETLLAETLSEEPLIRIDYAVLRDGATLAPIAVADAGSRILIAVRTGDVRLIDNAALV